MEKDWRLQLADMKPNLEQVKQANLPENTPLTSATELDKNMTNLGIMLTKLMVGRNKQIPDHPPFRANQELRPN